MNAWRNVFPMVFIAAIVWLAAPAADATPRQAVASGYWDAGATWGGTAPLAGDDVEISNNLTVTLTNATLRINSLIVSNATLLFTNLAATLNAGDITLLTNGFIVHGKNDATVTNSLGQWDVSARVRIDCTNLFIAAGGKINADAAGWMGNLGSGGLKGRGPGAGLSYAGGASYGGKGGAYFSGTVWPGTLYGSTNAPDQPGSGGTGHNSGAPHLGGDGGGLVIVTASNNVTVNGIITANGGPPAYTSSSGSGGGIHIVCKTFQGTNGIVCADGGIGYVYGGGGRISIEYNAAAEALVAAPTVQFSVQSGAASAASPPAGDLGSLYFTDGQFIRNPLTGIYGQLLGAATNYSFAQLTVSNAFVRFSLPGAILTVTNNLVLDTNAMVVLGGDSAAFRTVREYYTDATNGTALYVGGNLIVTNGGVLYVAAARSSWVQSGYGTLVAVTGSLTVATGSVIYAHSHPTTGQSVFFRANSVNVARGGVFNADAYGFKGASDGSSSGYGDGRSTTPYVGASYGGRGGAASGYSQVAVYGPTNAPWKPGSGGAGNDGNDHRGGNGGGLIRIQATDSVRVDGLVSAKSGAAVNMGSGGSGGGIFIQCATFSGSANGALQAQGGNSSKWTGNEGGGGGGRIAVWYGTISDADATKIINGQENLVARISVSSNYPSFAGAVSVAGGTNMDAGVYNGESGTIRFITTIQPPKGVIFMMR